MMEDVGFFDVFDNGTESRFSSPEISVTCMLASAGQGRGLNLVLLAAPVGQSADFLQETVESEALRPDRMC